MKANDSKRDIQIAGSPWLTARELARYLSVSTGTVYNWVSARYVPFVRRGGVVRFHRDEIDRWLRINACEGRAGVRGAKEEGAEQDAQYKLY